MEESWQLFILAGSLGLFKAGALAALLFSKYALASRRIAYACSVLGHAGLIASGIWGFSRETHIFTLYRGIFSFTDIILRINAFSAFFLLITGVIGLMVTLYGFGCTAEYQGRKSVPLLNTGMLIFSLAMAGVVIAGNIFTFLVAWEIMSIISYFLVVFEHERPEVQKAGFTYIVMTHIGTLFLTIAFFLLQHYSGSFEFQQMVHTPLPKSVQSWVFVLALIGFGTKAGLVPLHIWLPKAYPSAPSHIAAFMSGAMIKTAIYAFLLVTMQLLQTGPIWWGIAALLIGANSALFGLLHGLSEVDQKRMLAFSSIENMGLIFMGMGAAFLFQAEKQPLAASFALLAVLYHAANHAVFKSLLFMGAGAVSMSSGTNNMNLLGGLIRKMPWTALFMLIGSLAIASMPPMNGFINEWLLIQSIFTLGASESAIAMHLFGALMVALLTLVGALSAFLSIRFFALSFLSLPRSEMSAHAQEVPVSMLIGMGLLAAACILVGVFPYVIFSPVRNAIEALTGASVLHSLMLSPAYMSSESSKIAVGTTGLMIICGMLIAWITTRCIGGKTKTVRSETWACGNTLDSRMTYTASGFSKPILVAFQLLLQPSRRLLTDKDPRAPYFVRGFTYTSGIPLLIEDLLYKPIMKMLVAGARLFRRIQNGVVQSYLLYLLMTLVIILVWAIGR